LIDIDAYDPATCSDSVRNTERVQRVIASANVSHDSARFQGERLMNVREELALYGLVLPNQGATCKK
jgi:hypothetical protein